MSVFEKWLKGVEERNADALIDLLHEDFEFVRHQTGTSMNKDEMSNMIKGMYETGRLEIVSTRCIYENEEILFFRLVVEGPRQPLRELMKSHHG